ncbi:hypothetical protein A2U01_0068748, partial [Trifolium medium]|nr:hypothetical protein [Trifolium medium]
MTGHSYPKDVAQFSQRSLNKSGLMTDPWQLETTDMTLAYKDEDFLVDHVTIFP